MENNLTSKTILQMIKEHKVTPEQGVILYGENSKNDIMDTEHKFVSYYTDDWKKDSGDNSSDTPEDEMGLLIISASGNLNCEWPYILVTPGTEFQCVEPGKYKINIQNKDDYECLLQDLKQKGTTIRNIIYLLSEQKFLSESESLKRQIDNSIYSVFFLCKAMLADKERNPFHIFYPYAGREDEINPVFAGLSGFAKTFCLECPSFFLKTIQVSSKGTDILETALKELLLNDAVYHEVRYENGYRYVRELREIQEKGQTGKNKFCVNGTYIITGGIGELGYKMAEYLIKNFDAHVILVNRSKENETIDQKLHVLNKGRKRAEYISADVSKMQDVTIMVNSVKQRYGGINGIIHSAGVIRDAFVYHKSAEQMGEVFSPKVFGAINLDEATKDIDLDFFVMFSSLTAVIGNAGQSDYGYANSFLDYFARYRQWKQRPGVSLSVSWPLWADGGMNIDKDYVSALREDIGLNPMDKQSGIQALLFSLISEYPHVIPVVGDQQKLRNALQKRGIEETNPGIGMKMDDAEKSLKLKNTDELREGIQDLLKKVFSQETGISPDKVGSAERFEAYGLDSVMIMNLTRLLESKFGRLPKTLFFEYNSIEELSEYFIKNHLAKLNELTGHGEVDLAEPAKKISYKALREEENSRKTGRKHGRNTNILTKDPIIYNDIAIIGISGKYPMADNLDEYWKNLKEGKDCITEIPKERWDYEDYYQKGDKSFGRINSKWGGFINGVDHFDPLFFHISPREAELMDPQERLFLQTVWHTLEDAGYTRTKFFDKKVSVFVGAMYGHYQLFGVEESMKGNKIATNSSFASIANRVSYFFDFKGPSMTVDTMCSSSLTAIHLACRSLASGESDYAVAGGVNVTIHPNKYVLLGQGNFLASNGKCVSFANGGDGYVPGEGVGAILLKPLKKAQEDGDEIYGVIKATALNHGGRVNGFTVPNPKAQMQVIADAFDKSGIHPETINYIEAHGTGTSLGDPIEIAGLTQAFFKYSQKKQFCAIGSVKSNIGHLESAAGIAAVTKVLLQMRHRLLVPSIHSEKLNSNIDFEQTPFYVQRESARWDEAPVQGRQAGVYTRRAGISSFGAGGSNAHIIIEEYKGEDKRDKKVEEDRELILLSARNSDSLRDCANNLLIWLKKRRNLENEKDINVESVAAAVEKDVSDMIFRLFGIDMHSLGNETTLQECGCDPYVISRFFNELGSFYKVVLNPEILQCPLSIIGISSFLFGNYREIIMSHYQKGHNINNQIQDEDYLCDIAYTLQNCREHMDERLAFIVRSKSELIHILELYLSNKPINGNYLSGNVKDEQAKAELLTGAAGIEFTNYVIEQKDYSKLARLWLAGVAINWGVLTERGRAKKVRLPLYPFQKNRCWIPVFEAKNKPETPESIPGNLTAVRSTSGLQNISDFHGVKYVSRVNEKDFFINGFCDGIMAVHPLAFTEMACAAALTGGAENIRAIREVRWFHPAFFSVGNETEYIIYLYQNGNMINFAIEDRNEIKIAEGSIQTDDCNRQRETVEQKGRCVGNCQIPENEHYKIHPYFAKWLQDKISDYMKEFGSQKNYFPYRMENVEFFSALNGNVTVFIDRELSEEDDTFIKFNVSVYNEHNELCVKIQPFVVGEIVYEASGKEIPVVLEKEWMQSDLNCGEAAFGKIAVIANERTCQTAKSYFPEDIIIINNKIAGETSHCGDYDFDFYDSKQGATAGAELTTSKKIDVVIDMSDLEYRTKDDEQIQLGKVSFYQEIIKAHMKEKFKIIHFTSGLQVFKSKNRNIAGAITAGLIKTFGAEYKNIVSKTVDIDCDIHETLEIRNILNAEIGSWTNKNEYCWREKRRYEPFYKTHALKAYAKNTNNVWDSYKEKTIVISGGTRGIGAEIAKHLVENGVRKLVLMGITKFPPEDEWNNIMKSADGGQDIRNKISLIKNLRAKGAKIRLYNGDLTDRTSLKEFFDEVVSGMGDIGGVIHCAGVGLANNPAFIKKASEDITKVLLPKTEGLKQLYHAVEEWNPEFFVLFSSVSSQIPVLSAGASDYAAANGFMDYFAMIKHDDGYKNIKSVCWPNWEEAGMGRVKSDAYDQSGLLAISTEQGLRVLDAIMEEKECPVVMPCFIKKECFNADSLLEVKHKTEKAVKNGNTKKVKASVTVDSALMNHLTELLSMEIKVPRSEINENTPFEEYGVDSIILTEYMLKVENHVGAKLEPTIFLEYNSLKALCDYLQKEVAVKNPEETARSNDVGIAEDVQVKAGKFKYAVIQESKSEEWTAVTYNLERQERVGRSNNKIAVIGIGCNFPGKAVNRHSFWENLKTGKNCITEVLKSRWNADEFYCPEYKKGKSLSKWGGFIEGIELFDPEYFNFSKEDAEQIDPLMRQFMEVSVQALGDAGYEKTELSGKMVGVFAGARAGAYQIPNSDIRKNTIVGTGQNFIAAHLSHYFNFKGPSLVIDTACSSSLTSIHMACGSILAGECSMALAGGVDILLDEKVYLTLSEARALSPDGKCFTFDQRANGFVPGEGCGVVVLKSFDEAVRDGDNIYAVIEGSAVNNDGRTMGITTPNPAGQAAVISEALNKAGVSPETVSYVETHGTGTMIGDPIELKALTQVFQRYADKKSYCGVGSVKTNVGHLLSAAGAASFIKVALSLYHKQIPPSLNCQTPNQRFDFKDSPFYPNVDLREWKKVEGTRRAGISAFGFGGTNVHIIVKEFSGEEIPDYKKQRVSLPADVFQKEWYWTSQKRQTGRGTRPEEAQEEGNAMMLRIENSGLESLKGIFQ